MGFPPEIRCPDRHLADAKDISLRLSFRICQAVIRPSSMLVAKRLIPPTTFTINYLKVNRSSGKNMCY